MADWSSVFEETGEEIGDWDRDEFTTGGSRTNILQYLQGYSPVVAYFFTVNYILGVGCLGVPFAFQSSGIILGSVLIIVVSIVSYITVLFVAESSCRSVLLRKEELTSNPFRSSTPRKSPVDPPFFFGSWTVDSALENSSLLQQPVPKFSYFSTQVSASSSSKLSIEVSSTNKSSMTVKSRPRVPSTDSGGADECGEREAEVVELCQEFLGHSGKVFYQVSLSMLTFIGLLAYAQVFNAAFVEQIWPDCPLVVVASLFAAVVVPLSCCDLVEQISIQVLMSLLRFVSLGVLLIGTIVALCTSVPPPDSHPADSSNLIKWHGFGMMFTTAIFSQLFQHSVPGLIRPLSLDQKKSVKLVFAGALATTATLYIAIGSACVLFFGATTKQSINLNFVNYTWGIERGSRWGYPFAKACSLTVVMFPALDTLSVFPLIANTLGNNLYAAFPATRKHLRDWGLCRGDRAAIKRWALISWRLVAALPPIIGSLIVKDISFSLQLAGICGILVALVVPSLLQRACVYRLSVMAQSATVPMSLLQTPYSSSLSNSLSSALCLLVAFTALCICMFQLIATYMQ